ncbi:hypothetical protein [Neokomagataea anthophila]|uniref:RiboL-PSP-HEPN domain-containing protein n=1 Tax=Neokomagataea anthophila TaxID=2826925 RepID=A0ABS5E9F0_9PROT|nr:hypothetical protein [Neokomagataea anthophila]MBR0560494.1 hypothetical protein [Neokomagataea anthophila]
MPDDRRRIPQDPTYFQAIGLAAVAFARLEWDAVWCCERLELGYIDTIDAEKKTAGRIASDLIKLFSRVTDPNIRSKIEPFSLEFKKIVLDRNGILHGKPGSLPNGDQRLFRSGVPWTIEAVDEFSDRCTRASLPLNALLNNEFKEGSIVVLDPA